MATDEKAKSSSSTVPERSAGHLEHLQDLKVVVTIEIGDTELTLAEIASLDEHSLIDINRQLGEPVDVLLNGKLYARGEVVTVSENFGVLITEIVAREGE